MDMEQSQQLLEELQRAAESGDLPEDVLKAIHIDERGAYIDGNFSGVLVTGDKNIITLAPPVETVDERILLSTALGKYRVQLQEAQQEEEHLSEPYPGLYAYRLQDADHFFGRNQAINELLALLSEHRLVWAYGRSGVGKTSLIRAGLMPALLKRGVLPIYVRAADDPPTLALKKALLKRHWTGELNLAEDPLLPFLVKVCEFCKDETVVIFFDQFEELFTRLPQEAAEAFGKELQSCLADSDLDVKFVFSMRGDYFAETLSLRQHLPDMRAGEYALRTLSVEEAQQAIRRPAEMHEVEFEQGLVERVLADLGANEISPPQLQLICQKLYQEGLGEVKRITLDIYNSLGGAEGILRQYLAQTLQDNSQIPIEQQQAARYLLSTLVTPEGQREARQSSEWYTDSRLQPWALAWYAKREGLNLLDTDLGLQMLRQYATSNYLKQIESFVSLSGEPLRVLVMELSEPITNAYVRSINAAFVIAVVNTLRRVRLLDVVDKGRGEPVFELVHDYLTAEIMGWLDEGELEARRVRRMLDQKHHDYGTYQLLLEPRELDIVAAQLSNPGLELNDEDRRLLLYAAVAHGRGQRWMALAGESGALWLRQACQDDACPIVVRQGAAASLGAVGDRVAFEQLNQAVQESANGSKEDAFDLLAAYLHRTPAEYEPSRRFQWRVFRRLARLRVQDGASERRHMRRVAMVAALVGVTALFGAYAFGGLFRTLPLTDTIVTFFLFLLFSQISAYFFAEVITSLEMILQRQPSGWRTLILTGVGTVVGVPLFVAMTGTGITWFWGGLIGFTLGVLNTRPEPRPPVVRWGLSVLAGIAVATIALLSSTPVELKSATAATITTGFVLVYLLFRNDRLLEKLRQA